MDLLEGDLYSVEGDLETVLDAGLGDDFKDCLSAVVEVAVLGTAAAEAVVVLEEVVCVVVCVVLVSVEVCEGKRFPSMARA